MIEFEAPLLDSVWLPGRCTKSCDGSDREACNDALTIATTGQESPILGKRSSPRSRALREGHAGDPSDTGEQH